MRFMVNRHTRSGQLAFLLFAVPCVAMFQLGCSEVQDIDQIRQTAEQGDAEAQFNLGNVYYIGEGTPQDYAEAVKWYRKAAEQGFAKAQYNLGVMYGKGAGVEEDDQEAVKWYRKAAEQGYASAQYNLGNMYSRGEGVEEDNQEAVKWYRKAAEQGYASAQVNLGVMFGKGEGVAEDNREAVKWYRKAAEQGNVKAQANLGVMYGKGAGVEEDDQEAVKWFQKAAEQGDADAQNKLGFMYSEGEGVLENDREAVKWYREAAEQGHAPGQLSMGYMYFTGEGVPKDYLKAYNWWNLAADQGNKTAAKVKDQLESIMTAEQLAKAQDLAAELYNPIGETLIPPPTPEQLTTRKEREHKAAMEASLEEEKNSLKRAPSQPKRERTLSEKITMGDKLDPEDNLTIIADPSWDQRESYRRRFGVLLNQFDESCPDLEGKEQVGATLVKAHMQLKEAGLGGEEGLLDFSNAMHRMVTEIGTQARMAEMPLPGCVQLWAMYTTIRYGGFSPEKSRGAVTAMANLGYTAAMEK